MATKIPKVAGLTFSLNAGINPGNGLMKKESVTIGNFFPGSETDALAAFADAIKTLFLKPVVSTTLVERSLLI